MANVTIRVRSAPIRMIVRAAQGATTAGGGSGAATWGGITGTLSAQTDLQNALNAKQATLTNYSMISALTGYPSTFPPTIGTSGTTAAAGNHLHAGVYLPVANPTAAGTLSIEAGGNFSQGAGGTFTCGAVNVTISAASVWRTALLVPASDPAGITGADAVSNIVSLTQAEYDAIGTKNATTLYVIV